MKNNVRRALAISGLAIAIGTSGFAYDASANGADRNITRSHQERTAKTRRFEHRNFSRRAFSGIASNVSDHSLTLTRGAKIYTVTITPTTKLLSHNWNAITISDIKDGNKIRIFGTLADTAITAKTIRKISIQ